MQFDGFVPVLKTVEVSAEELVFSILIDSKTLTATLSVEDFVPGYKLVLRDDARYIGVLVFGRGARSVFDFQVGQTLKINTSFLPIVVKSIPSNCGVYSINDMYGALTVTNQPEITETVDGQNVTFNALALCNPDTDKVLLTLNGVLPTGNNITIDDSELIKVLGAGSSVNFSLIGGDPSITQLYSVIPTEA